MSNVKQNEIDVTFSSTNIMKSVAARYQWDKGIVLNISGIESDKTIMAHCSFEGQLSPAVVVVTSMMNGVCTLAIPDELFMQTKAIRCYLYAESSDIGVTVYEIRIPIIARPKPGDYIYDPTEVIPNVSELLAEIENMRAATQEANEAAEYAYGVSTIRVQDEEPTEEHVEVWIDTDSEESFASPEIKDNLVLDTDTWSSKKIDKEIRQLSEEIGEITTEKLTQISDATMLGKYISGFAGNMGQVAETTSGASQWEVTDYVDVSAYKQVAITAGAFTNRLYYAFYDADKQYISGSGRPYTEGVVLRDEIVDVPTGAQYCVAMWYYSTSENSPIIKGVSLMPKVDGAVRFDIEQTLEDTQKAVGRTNIGAASMEAVEAVKTQVDAEKQLTTDFTDGYFVNAANGNIVGDSRYSASDYIYIRCLETLTFPCWFSGQYAGAAIYDQNKQFVRGVTLVGSVLGAKQTVQLGDGDCYIRITCQTAQLTNFTIVTANTAAAVVKLGQLIEDDDAIDTPMYKIIRDGGMTSIFRKIGAVVDSLGSGEMAYGGSTDEFTTKYVDMYDLSWIQFLARACGSTAYNFGQGGMNTRNFLADLGGHLTNMRNPEKKCQAYFIALGHNDSNYGVSIGNPDDINLSDPTHNADTYYGNYARIIAEIKAVEPDAKIFCICMKSSGFAAYNAAIRHMATIFDNVYVLDFETYYPKLETSWEYTEGHGNAMGYLNYSWQIGTYVDWIIRHNRDEFKYVQFIGTDYAQYIP